MIVQSLTYYLRWSNQSWMYSLLLFPQFSCPILNMFLKRTPENLACNNYTMRGGTQLLRWAKARLKLSQS
jgi:hypothetical protein